MKPSHRENRDQHEAKPFWQTLQAKENGWNQHTPGKTKSRPLGKFLWNDAFWMTLTPLSPTQVWPKFRSLPECGSNDFAKAAFIDAGRWSLAAGGWLKKNTWIKEMGARVLFFESFTGLEPICTYSWRQEGAATWWDILPLTLRTLNSKIFYTTWWRGKPCRPLPSQLIYEMQTNSCTIPRGHPKPNICLCIWLSKARGSHNPRLIWPHRTWAGCAYLQRQTSERASLDPRPRRNQSNR